MSLARRSSPRAAASMRARVAGSSSRALSSSCLRSRCASARNGVGHALQADGKSARGIDRIVAQGLGVGFERIESVVALRAGADMGVGGGEKKFAGPARGRIAHAPDPALACQRARRRDRLVERGVGRFVLGDQVLQPFVEPAHAAARAPLGTADPAAQIGHLGAGEKRGEAGIGGIEQMMAFVEDVAHAPLGRRIGGLIAASQSCAACAITSA